VLRALFAANAIGLGHAARAVALAKDLERELGVEPFFLGAGPVVDFVAANGYDVQVMEPPPPFEARDGVLVNAGSWYRRYFAHYRRMRRWLRDEVAWAEFRFALADGDVPVAAAAKDAGLPVVLVAHRLRQDFARSAGARLLEWIGNRAYRRIARRLDLILALEEPDGGNVRHIEAIARLPKRSREQLRDDLQFRKKMILVTAGGSNLGGFLVDAAVRAALSLHRDDVQVVASTGPALRLPAGLEVFNYAFVPDQHDLIAAADLVVSTAGKSTIAQARAVGTPIIAIPVRGHAEGERNAAALGYRHEDIRRLRELIEAKLDAPRPPPAPTGNAAAITHVRELLVTRGILGK
jgi:UDP-N-acetylglucosamine--N-acetylmuramyl-(pentapeptide) pyrophosphoryl-undecaprenol N-acetylglucosamine transferase